MTDRPILFSAPMIRALLDGRKTQTRRVINPQPQPFEVAPGQLCEVAPSEIEGESSARLRLGIVITTQKLMCGLGDRLWVREAHALDGPVVRYYATDDVHELRQRRPSIFMPRWASRLTLTVTDVRVQRLQEINGTDCRAEGVFLNNTIDIRAPEPLWSVPGTAFGGRHPHEAFRSLWDSLNADRAPWALNPWVVALTFTVHRSNIDQIEGA